MNKNKKVRLYVNGVRHKDIYQYKTKWEVFKLKVSRFFARLIFLSVIVGIVYGIFWMGGELNPATIYTKAEVIKEVEASSPVLERIAGCESQGNRNLKGTHYDKNGQVLMRSNTNRTVDIGKYQINTVWFAKATELGLDLTLEKDNEEMARWIYKNRGTGDWSASAKCWK